MVNEYTIQIIKWSLILFCVSQSAVFSGLNLAFFSVSKLRLTIEKEKGNPDAEKILKLREDSNFLLTTILWGNVGINVMLALISESVLTRGGRVCLFHGHHHNSGRNHAPGFFSRHAIRSGALLSPVIRFYRVLLFPVAKPSAWVLDQWLGKEAIPYFQEDDFRQLKKSM